MDEAVTWGVVGGYVDEKEAPIDAAKRELLEETGFESNHWIHLADMVADANRGMGVGHLFLAVDATYKGVDAAHDDLEAQELVVLSQNEAEELMLSTPSGMKMLSWGATMAYAMLHLNRLNKNTKPVTVTIATESQVSAAAASVQ
jgi:ADP-ribose diphosphatase